MPDPIYKPATVIFAGSLMLQSMARPTTAVSFEASTLRENMASVGKHYEQSIALFGNKSRLIGSLHELAEECAEEDWDGYGACAVHPVSVANAESFIRALPERLELPELSIDPDGAIAFDWIPDRSRTLTLSIDASNRLAYAWIDGTDRGHAAVKFENGILPTRILSEIEKITHHATSIWAS